MKHMKRSGFCWSAAIVLGIVALPVLAAPEWVVTTNFRVVKDTSWTKLDPDKAYGTSNAMTYKAGWYVTNAGGTQDLKRTAADFGTVISSQPAGSHVSGARMQLTPAAGNGLLSIEHRVQDGVCGR